MTILEQLKRDAAALPLLKDWLGEGLTPVDQALAEQRAQVCRSCRENVEPGWWDRVKLAVAEIIRKEIEIKRKMGVRVEDEETLAMCSVCGCCLILKIHVPLHHIKAHTPEDTMAKFPPWCWIKKELAGIAPDKLPNHSTP